MNRVRIVKKDYQKLLKGLPQDHPPHLLDHRYGYQEYEQSPEEPRTICYTTGVYKDKLGGMPSPIGLAQHLQPSGKQLFKKHVLQNDRLFGQDNDVERELKHYRRNLDDTKRIKTLQRSIELYNHTEERSDKLRRKDIRALSNPRRQPKLSPYVKRLNRQSLNVSRDRTKTNLQSSSKVMRLPHDQSQRSQFKIGSMSEMKIVDRRNLRLRQDELLERGKTAYQQNKFVQAIELFSHLLAKNPKHLEGNYLMAVSLMGRNEFSRALRYFDNVVETDPAYNRNVFILYAICCKKLSQSQQAVNKLSSCIEMFPQYYDAYIYRGKLKLKEKKLAQAIADFVRANEINSEKSHGFVGLADCFYSMKDDNKAYEMYSRALKMDASLAQSPVCLKVVTCLSGMSRTEEALSLVNDYIAKHSNSGEALLLKGNLLATQKKHNQAVMVYDQLIKLNDRKYNTKALQCMIKARICERDFYSAYHLIERIEFLEVDRPALDRIRLFAEAVLNLMKRKFSEAVEMFEDMTRKFPFLVAEKDVSPDDELQFFLKPLHHLYSAYGYFCLSDYQHSRDEYARYESILKGRNRTQRILESSTYNKTICEGLLKYEAKEYGEAIERLSEASAIYPNKVEPYIYRGIISVQTSALRSKQDQEPELMLALQMFTKGIEVMGEASNNTIANIYYHRAVVHAYLGIWNEAINDIDRAIEKSEDNIPKYFYLRGLCFACCQSFKQAIHDLSVCLSINENYAEAFLMRSKCLQIEGQANEAFVDLQRYITLKPEDPFIHKYAGHLLFENGAFEDSILAYAHGEALPDRDMDIFLTRGKAYFLLGEFGKAYEDLLKVADQTHNEQNQVDLATIKALWEMKEVQPKCYEHAAEEMTHILKENTCEGRIFKQKEFHMIRGGAFLYSGRYKQALLEFTQCMTLREAGNNKLYSDDEQQDVDEADQISAYLNHMRFNSALCYIMLGDFNRAKDMCNKCTIQKQKTTLQLLLCAIKYELDEPIEIDEREATLEVRELEIFSLKNKLSKHLATLNPKFKLNQLLTIRPCFSFPKVEPPEITPEFDRQMLLGLQPSLIENKPEAPWIRRADNSCIMFTSNIQVFDNLDLETEQKTKRNDQELGQDYSAVDLDNEFYKSNPDVSEMSRKDIEKVKQKLKLEGDIEKKLNKLIRRQHS